MRILITGSNGFIGRRLCRIALEKGYSVRAVVRHESEHPHMGLLDLAVINDIGPSTDWTPVLQDIDIIIHLAARVHVMHETSEDPISNFRRINVDGTRRLALAAVQAGVRRIVYVSTIKVNGESTCEKPFSENDVPSPQDDYSISKWEAEEALYEISSETGLEIVIMRPPLVYGPGVKGNMVTLMRYVDRRYPLPFGGIRNKRSLISLDNLADALLTAATKTECAGRTFLVSDGEDLSTSELIKWIACAMNRRPHLLNIPEKVFSVIGAMVPALRPIIERVTASLVIDSTLFRRTTGWRPTQTVNAGMKAMVAEYLLKK